MENVTTFKDLYTWDYNLTDIYAERQKWVDGALFKREYPRQCNGIIFLNGCSGTYTDKSGESFSAYPKDIVCLPYRSEYSVLNQTSKEDFPDAYLIEFNIVREGKKYTFAKSPFLISEANSFYVKEITREIVEEYESLRRSPGILKSKIYKLLSYLGKEEEKFKSKTRLLIAPATEYLENNPHSSLSVSELAQMCHLSPTAFRKLFTEYTGKSPIKYIIDRKTDMAKKMLENSTTPVQEISELLEFESVSYFCKLFKKKTGMTPGEYRKGK